MEGFDVAQLAHVELYTPNPEGTLWFFKEVLGLEEPPAKAKLFTSGPTRTGTTTP
jgi:hypothetical protein